ncbi:MAG: hypothetical protein QME51_01145 [Planctomycetota bacterium]|nr:hypothetical protein [Planctomycetota bacterium]MDI6786963.1 hypothetical protein [Planctomycetota bacterium]
MFHRQTLYPSPLRMLNYLQVEQLLLEHELQDEEDEADDDFSPEAVLKVEKILSIFLLPQ